MSQQLNAITVASDGSVFGIDQNNNILQAVYGQPLTQVTPLQTLSDISAASDGTTWGIAKSGAIQSGVVQYQYVNGAWQTVDCGTASVTQLSVGSSQNIWAVDGHGNAYQYVNGQFTLQGTGSSVSATADGSAWGLDGQGAPQRFNGSSWQPVTPYPNNDPFTCLSAGTAGWVWALGKSGNVYQYDGPGNQWLQVSWLLERSIASLSCGDDGTVWALSSSGDAYSYGFEQQDWIFAAKLANGPLAMISVADAGNIWALGPSGTSGNIYQNDAMQVTWSQVGAGWSSISAASLTNIWGVDKTGNVYQNTGGPANWNPIHITRPPFHLSAVSAAADGTLWGLSGNAIFRYTGPNSGWESLFQPSTSIRVITVGSAANIWALDSNFVYQYQGGSEWQQSAVPVALTGISAAADGSVWGVAASGQVYMYTGLSTGILWYPTGISLSQIAVGSATDIWGIDQAGNAVNVLAGPTQVTEASAARLVKKPGSLLPAFDTESVFDEAQSTHLWIVNRAATLTALTGNNFIFNLVQPSQGQSSTLFSQNLCQGLYDADFLSPYNGPHLFGQPYYVWHFYDPDDGENYLWSSTNTALTRGQFYFFESLDAWTNENLEAAGYNLGLALHYFTDMMQPMHSANFSWFSSQGLGYHTAFETFVMENQSNVTAPTQYTASNLPANPGAYIIAGAMNSKHRYFKGICPSDVAYQYDAVSGLTTAQQNKIRPLIAPILTDAITLTAQYLTLWMSLALFPLINSVIVSAISGKVMDVPHGSTSAGTQLQQYTWNGGHNQSFLLHPVPNSEGIFLIYPNCANGLVLDVGTEGHTAYNTPVFQNTYSPGSTSQQWQLLQIDEVSVAFQNVFSGQFLTVSPPLSQAESKLVQSLQNTSGAQQWYIAQANTAKQMLLAANNDFAIDVNQGSSDPGTTVQIWTSNGTAAQIFLWVALGGDDIGYSMILNQASGLVISAGSGLVVTDYWDSSDSGKWRTVPVVEGSSAFYIQVKSSGFYLYAPSAQQGKALTLTSELVIATAFTFQPVSANAMAGISGRQSATVAAAANAAA